MRIRRIMGIFRVPMIRGSVRRTAGGVSRGMPSPITGITAGAEIFLFLPGVFRDLYID